MEVGRSQLGPDPQLRTITQTQGFSENEWKERISRSGLLRCVVDYPSSRKGASFGLQIVGEWGEAPPKRGESGDGGPGGRFLRIIPLEHFRDGMKELEKSIACLRVYWESREQEVLVQMLGDEEIKNVVLEEVMAFKPGVQHE